MKKGKTEMDKLECLMYASSEGMNSYVDAFVLNHKRGNSNLISNNYFDKQYCSSESNLTHFSCT